jgi:hypothetical protein
MDRSMKALWVDPGETVGWAAFEIVDGVQTFDGGKTVVEAKLPDVLNYGNTKMQRFALELLKHAAEYDVIGFEPYTISPDKLLAHAGSDVPTLQVVGMIRLASWAAQDVRKDGFPRIVESPRNRKTRGLGAVRLYLPEYEDIVLEALNGPHDDGHFGDAILHGAAWYYDNFGNKPHALQS